MTEPASHNGTPSETPFELNGESLAASLTVNDLQKSLNWYQHALGFALDRRHERDGKLMAVSIRAGSVRLLLGQDDGAKGPNRAKGEGFSLQITTAQDVDQIASRLKASGAQLASEPASMPWGARMFRVRDPDGFMLVVSADTRRA